jgi:hypothetical protein
MPFPLAYVEYGLARVAAIYEPRGNFSHIGPRRLYFDAGFQPALFDQLYEPGEAFGGRSGNHLVEEDEPVEVRTANTIEL